MKQIQKAICIKIDKIKNIGYINSMIKQFFRVMLLAVAVCNVSANDYRYSGVQNGSGYTKGDAVASALVKLPYGAKIEKVNVNGHAVRQFVKGVGYIQTYGSHKATIHYTR